jgi:dephospho-CoA kinase
MGTNESLTSPQNAAAKRPKVIGLCGGIASGKSAVASELERLGAIVIRADQIGHTVLEDPEVKQQLMERFGPSILSPESTSLSRPAIAAIVFADNPEAPKHLKFLESVTHPSIRKRIFETLAQLRSQEQPPPAIVLDIPLLLESNWQDHCDAVLFVDTPIETRLQRAHQRGWTKEQYYSRQASQMSLEQKKKLSTDIIENHGTLADLHSTIQTWWHRVIH